jgi:hypothetical protein
VISPELVNSFLLGKVTNEVSIFLLHDRTPLRYSPASLGSGYT